MATKPTYEELESKVRDLELELEKRRSIEKSLADSEFILNNFFKNSHDYMGIIEVLDDEHDLRYVKLNEATGRYLGKSPEALQGMLGSQIGVTEEVRCLWIEQCRKSERTGTRVQFEYKRDLPDGTHTLLASVQMVKSPFFSFVVTDITNFKQAEEALRESVENFKQLAENANDGILIACGDGKHVYANTRVSEILGFSEDEILKMTIRDLAHPDEYSKIKKRYCTILKGGSFQSHYETMVICKDKKELPVEVSSALTTWHGQPADLIILRDISDRKKMEAALKKAHAELEKRVEKRTTELKLKTKSLEELNTAMKVLLEKRAEDKIKLEDNVLTNTKDLIEPLIVNMRETELNEHQKMILNIIESSLEEITSNFTRKLSMEHLNLTPTEMKIASYIKHGTTTKKIAEIMKSSPRTIETHRKNIREKVGLKQNRRNLRSYLLSLH